MKIIKIKKSRIYITGAHTDKAGDRPWHVIPGKRDSFDPEFFFFPVSIETIVLHATFSYIEGIR